MIYDDNHQNHYQPHLDSLRTTLPCAAALTRLKETILELDRDASVSLVTDGQTARWTSSKLAEPVVVSALEEVAGTSLWFEGHPRDAELCAHAKASFEQIGSSDVSCSASRTVLEVVETLMADPAWTKHVLVLPQAIIAAADCPYIRLNRLSVALECLAVYAARRASSRGISAEQVAIEAGLGNVYRPHISFTAANKHRSEYVARWNNRAELMREHLTLGGGCNDRNCMSVHFFWDVASRRVVIGHIGRHGTNALTNT